MSDLLCYRLGDICNVINGRAYSQPELLNKGKYKVLRVGNFFSNTSWYFSDLELSEEKYCHKGDLLFAWSASFGPRIWNEDNTIYHYHIWKLEPKEKVLSKKFLYYYLLNKTKSMLSSTHGSIMLHITKAYMEDIQLHLPYIETQITIASILEALDSKIELNNRINAELEAMAKTIYDYWFVQFDFPDKKGKPYKTSSGKMVWNESLKREIPEGWTNGTVGDIADLIRGVSYSKEDIAESNDDIAIPILRATNISNNVIDLYNMVYVPMEFVSEKQFLQKFDILMTMSSGSTEHIGKNGFYYFDEQVSFGAFCAKLVAKKKFRYYLYSYMQSPFLNATIKNECLGTNINNLNGSLVSGFKMVIPAENILEMFNSKVENYFYLIANNMKQNQQLTELRDWLLPMLMNGQVKVKEAEEMLSMAAEGEVEYKRMKERR